MFSTAIRVVAVVSSLIIGTSFLLFVVDETRGGTDTAQAEIAGDLHPVKPPAKPHGQPRKFIDEVAHDLTTPFNHIVKSDDAWASHFVPTILGLILFGFGFGFLARVVAGRE